MQILLSLSSMENVEIEETVFSLAESGGKTMTNTATVLVITPLYCRPPSGSMVLGMMNEMFNLSMSIK